MSDTTSNDSDVQFTGGEKAWNKYLTKNLHFPSGYEFKTGYQAVVVVTGTINEEGKVIDVEVSAPLYPAFDKIALEALKDSPKWVPAVSHNRKVYDTFSLAINFSQSYY
jgi:Gram-negative bacterial TonB protein C-terminal